MVGPRRARNGIGGLRQELDEPEAGPLAVALAKLELVRERLDDRDSEAALDEVVLPGLRRPMLEAVAVVRDLDREPVGLQLVEDLDVSPVLGIGVTDGVRARLRERELQVGKGFVGELANVREAGQREA